MSLPLPAYYLLDRLSAAITSFPRRCWSLLTCLALHTLAEGDMALSAFLFMF